LRSISNKDCRLEIDELNSESIKRRAISSRGTVFKSNVPVVGVAKFSQGLPKCLMVGVAAGNPAQKSYPWNLLGLCLGGDRRKQKAKGQSGPANSASPSSLQPESHVGLAHRSGETSDDVEISLR
jgi:hypothetical protein